MLVTIDGKLKFVLIFNDIVGDYFPPAATVIGKINLDAFAKQQSLIGTQAFFCDGRNRFRRLVGLGRKM